jgi:glycerate 2-kinase
MPELKQLARAIFRDTLAAIDIPAAMERKLARDGTRIRVGDATIDLADCDRFRAIAIGKAAMPMARGLSSLLAPEITLDGIVVAPHDTLAAGTEVPGGFRAIGAGHPLPDVGSLVSARAILDLLHTCDEGTAVFFLLSGGGSALVESPLDPRATLADVQRLHAALVGCGASIDEINSVRKHLSAVKGGRLAAAAPSALKITLGVTDVPAGCESALGSGPTIPDPTTLADARAVLDRYALQSKLPPIFRAAFEASTSPPLAETPKLGDSIFARSYFALVLGMHDLFHHAHQAAEAHGFVTVCDNSTDDWPVAAAAADLLSKLDGLGTANPRRRVALIADGELSSPFAGDGIGGRNSAFVLECAERIAGRQIAVLSAGTDGKDGSSPAAGAVADGETLARARIAHLDPQEFAHRSDSYHFFRALDDVLVTGPTGNNLRDLRILLAEPS